jgi:anti-sigma factor RsiW
MSCSPFDLKDYYFGELPTGERRQVEAHVAACSTCREELDALSLTRAALLSVPDEEPPHRIAFVSDKVLEPSWWQRIWATGPRLAFASAAMLSFAILAHGVMMRPSQTPVPVQQASTFDKSQIEAELDRRVKMEVEKAVMASEVRQMSKLVDAIDQRTRQNADQYREQLVRVADYLERMQKRFNVINRVSYDGGAIQ